MKKLISHQVLCLCIFLISINITQAQTTYGTNAGTQGDQTDCYYGLYSGANNTEGYNSFFGFQSGRYNETGAFNSFFGAMAGQKNIVGEGNSFFGWNAGRYNIGNENSFIGNRAGQNNESGEKNTFLGGWSGYWNINGENNSYIGYEAGRHSTGNSNVFLGYNAGRMATGNSNVFIGNEAGYNENGDNKLYITNNRTNPPLIYGDFATSEITFNGKIGIASSTSTSILENGQHNHMGILENFLRIKASENGTPVEIFEDGRIVVGSDDVCLKHISENDTTFMIVDGVALKYGDPFWQSASDQNLKKNISPLKSSLNKFLNLNFYSYQYKKTNQTRYGILAQEMESIFPHSMGKLIEEDETEYLTFNPNNLFYTGLKATQEIGELTLNQKAKIESLEKENDLLKLELETIKTALKNYGINIAQQNNNSLKPDVPHLLQNKPNPFSETTTIQYFLPENTQQAVIIIYDASGKKIKEYTLSNHKGYGNIALSLMKNNLSKGTYSYSLLVNGHLISTKKLLFQ